MTDIDTLCRIKLKKSTGEYELTSRLIRMLDDVKKAVNPGDKKMFERSVYNPILRRYEKAISGMQFWSDKDKVVKWIEQQNAYGLSYQLDTEMRHE